MSKILIGIDVGGTFTDGVICSAGNIIGSAKHPTQEFGLQDSIFAVLDDLLREIKGKDIEGEIAQVVLSTTLVTNLLATGGGERAALVLIPGPGLNLRQLKFFPHTYIAGGATDFPCSGTARGDRKRYCRSRYQ